MPVLSLDESTSFIMHHNSNPNWKYCSTAERIYIFKGEKATDTFKALLIQENEIR